MKYFAIPYFIFITNNLLHEFSLTALKNSIHMVMYLIHWERDPDFPRKDLITKQKEKSYFDCTYLLLDGMNEPFDLIDPKSNFNQFRNIF